ncbi:hypothetical protein Q31b_50860 [Novipirellula aureliae]|uniref:ABC-three component systems C-terminal domain-containing protein n=1 Tax=Novipirellula aureliae TaxID=2527966 RepID=A0A5C6DJ94_9BACT|nr:ABC-three component system protein [Novipirellula aureliae]TWU35651.1 hypothetical protein Q31b_50860 [Novipirellula aureliae]
MTTQPANNELAPLPRPKQPENVTPENVGTGILVPPIKLIRLFSPDDWEEFVLEWADSFRDDYFSVNRSGGAGDMGRDVVASVDDSETVWENFQCKHYKSAITPSDIWCEFGKLIYYACRGEFTYPRKYVFVASQGAGNKLAKLLKDPEKLKNELKANWASYCENAITETTAIPLKGQLLKFLDKADFGIFSAIPPLRLIEQHRKTPYHVYRFGGGLPNRPTDMLPPAAVADIEVRYVRALLDAYGSNLSRVLNDADELKSFAELRAHFDRSRHEFYSAESLKRFSRDTLPPGSFEELQREYFDGIMDEVDSDHSDGFARVKAVIKLARVLQITSHPLVPRMETRDRGGICHQLANDERVRWVK